MNSSNHPSAYGYQQPRPPTHENTVFNTSLEVETKSFLLALKENPRGRFLRITENKGTHYSSIIIPATGLKELQKVLAEIIKADDATGPANPPTGN